MRSGNEYLFETLQVGGPLEADRFPPVSDVVGLGSGLGRDQIEAAESVLCDYCEIQLEADVGIGELVRVTRPAGSLYFYVLCGPCSVAETLDDDELEKETNR
jgi:hypothetical protein